MIAIDKKVNDLQFSIGSDLVHVEFNSYLECLQEFIFQYLPIMITLLIVPVMFQDSGINYVIIIVDYI